MEANYTQSGNIIVIAGLIVSILSHFGFSTNAQDIAQVIASTGIVIGVIKQWLDHKKLAQVAGALPPR